MSLTAENISRTSAGVKDVESVYRAVFPKDEQLPMWFLFWRAKKAGIDFIKFVDDKTFVGFAYTIKHHDLLYVFYLAVDPKLHSKGYGSKILDYIEKNHPGYRLALELEDPDQLADNSEQRHRRKSFYLKNGFESTGIKTREGKVVYELLSKNGTCSISEFAALMRHYSGLLFSRYLKPHIVK